jgi:glucuronosyltransferase
MLCALGSIDAYKILLLIPFPGPSHFLMFKVFIKELVDRGHEVTSITAFPYNEKLANYTEIKIEPTWSFGDDCELF